MQLPMRSLLLQEKPFDQICIFCGPQWDARGQEDSVSKCFEKCVVEAVSAASQVSDPSHPGDTGFAVGVFRHWDLGGACARWS